MKRVVVVGSSNTDMVIRVPRIPGPGETILGGTFAVAAGGKGANQAVAAARAGGQVTFVARVGDDIFGERSVAGFENDGLDTRFVYPTPGSSSGVALIAVDERGENSISVASGANALLSVEDIVAAEEAFAAADIVLVQLESPLDAVEAAVRLAGEKRVPVILNPAPARPLGDDLLRRVAFLTPNEHEAAILTRGRVESEPEARAAAARLRARGPETVIITLGARGVFVAGPAYEGLLPAFNVHPVDTTAAGDVFNGALAVALAERTSLGKALRFAQAAAAISVTRPGAQPSAPTRADIEDYLGR
jgi:ribokinase